MNAIVFQKYKNIILSLAVILISILTLSRCAIIPGNTKKEVVREVVVKTQDTIIIAKVLATKQKIKTDPQKQYFWYMDDKIHSNYGGYTGNLLHGEFRKFDSNRNLIEKGRFEYGLKDGEWFVWDREGKLLRIYVFSDGALKEGVNFTERVEMEEAVIVDSVGHKRSFFDFMRSVKRDTLNN